MTTRDELPGHLAQAMRDANGTLEAMEAWRRAPQLVPMHVYAEAIMPLVDAYVAEKLDEVHERIRVLDLWDGTDDFTAQDIRQDACHAVQVVRAEIHP